MSEASETYYRAFQTIAEELSRNGMEGRDVIGHLGLVQAEGDPSLWVAILRTMGYGLDSDSRIVDLLDRQRGSN